MLTQGLVVSRSAAGALGAALLLGLAHCGGGPSLSRLSAAGGSNSFQVQVSAGGPVSGATITVYAIQDGNGDVDTTTGNRGVIGSGGPTDASGRAAVTLSTQGYLGPVQVVASGATMTYPDPTVPAVAGQPPALVQVPSTFVFSSYLTQLRTGTGGLLIPASILSTLADHAVLAFCRGRDATHPATTSLTKALLVRDQLFVTHFTASADAWNPLTLRTTVPSMLASGGGSLVDAGYAALFDIALNQLARDTAAKAGYGAGSTALTAITLAQLLEEDLDVDAQFNGKGLAGRTLTTQGTTPVALDAQFLRNPLAQALDAWVQNASLNVSGIQQADLIGAQVFSAMSQDGSDLFGDSPAGLFDPVDRVPPQLAVAAEPAQYSNTSAITLTITPTDPSGVQAVFALVGTVRSPAVRQADGTWQVPVQLPAVGHNTVAIWAEDFAQPTANSGFGMAAPYQLTRDIVYDPTAPAVSYDANFPSYSDERSMQVAVRPDGIAQVPAAYTTAPKSAVVQGGDFFKAVTRLAGGPAASAAELETANAQNIPVLRFAVPFNANTDSPIVKASYTVHTTCPSPCPVFPDATGALLASSTNVPQQVLFDLPLSTEFVPALSSVQGPATLSVIIDLADAASNTSSTAGFTWTFHVIGPPLAISEDTLYPGAGKTDSTYSYRLVNGSYATLWSGSTQIFPGGAVRLLRYVISNPEPQPVAMSVAYTQAPQGSWQAIESWPRFNVPEPTGSGGSSVLNNIQASVAFGIDGFTFHQAQYWKLPYGTSDTRFPGISETALHPCGGRTLGHPIHRLGDSVSKYLCDTALPFSLFAGVEAGAFSSASVSYELYRPAPELGGQEVPPTFDATSQMFIVPPASAGVPGALVLYLTRPLTPARSRGLQWNALVSDPARAASNHFQVWDYELFMPFVFNPPYAILGQSYEVYLVFRSGGYLATGTENLFGSLNVTTQGYSGLGRIGESQLRVSTTLSRQPLVTH